MSTIYQLYLLGIGPTTSIQLQLLRPNRHRSISAGAVHDLQPPVVCPQPWAFSHGCNIDVETIYIYTLCIHLYTDLINIIHDIISHNHCDIRYLTPVPFKIYLDEPQQTPRRTDEAWALCQKSVSFVHHEPSKMLQIETRIWAAQLGEFQWIPTKKPRLRWLSDNDCPGHFKHSNCFMPKKNIHMSWWLLDWGLYCGSGWKGQSVCTFIRAQGMTTRSKHRNMTKLSFQIVQ